nr:hypothetical protein [Tanacetum cinerariifolium]
MNQNFYNSNSSGFDQFQPPQFLELAEYINTPSWNHHVFYDDDDDEDCTIAITLDFSITDSLSMGDEHLDTIPETKSDKFIKSSVENHIPIPSESEDECECECDVPDWDDSQTKKISTFSNPLFDDSTSSDDESSHEEDIHEMSFKTYSNPLFDLDEEIISSDFNPIHNEDLELTLKNDRFDTEPYLFESLPNPDCSTEEDIHLVERLLYDNSSPRPPEEFVFENSNADIESFSPSPIPNEDSDSHMEEIDLSFTPDDPMPPGIEEEDYDSERDIPILEELLENYSLSLPANESYHFDIPLPYRPPTKPPVGKTGNLNIKMMGDVSDQKVPIPGLTITRILNQDNSPDLLPHQGLAAFQPSAECPMIINEKNIPLLDVLETSPCFRKRLSLMLLEHQDVIVKFCGPSRWKELTKKRVARSSHVEMDHAGRRSSRSSCIPTIVLEDNQTSCQRGEHAAQISTPYWKCPVFYDDDDDEYSIQYREYLENSSNAITPDLLNKEPNKSLSMGDEHLDTNPETESDEVIKSSVEDLVPIPSESEGISDDTCDVPFCDNSPPLDVLNDHFKLFFNFNNDCTSCDDFSPINIFEEKSMTFSNPLFNSNEDFTSSDDESLSDEDVPVDNVKIYLNPLFKFDDEYIFSDINPLFDEDEYFTPGDDVELLLHRDPSMSVVSVFEGFTDEPHLEENNDLFELESKKNEWKKILYDAPFNDLMTEDSF